MASKNRAHDRFASIVSSAERILARSLGGPVRLGDPIPLGGERQRSALVRCSVQDGPVDGPRSVVAKITHADEDALAADETVATRARQAFLTERAALAFLSSLPMQPPVAPRLYGADPKKLLLVLEDLGAGISLADLLIGNDPDAAVHGLTSYARTLGRLHATTMGREEEYASFRHDAADASARAWAGIGDLATADLPKFAETCASLGIPLDASFEREIRLVRRTVEHPGPFLAFNVSDACPDNHFVAGDTVRLFDFEFSGFGHALLDGSYLRLPFPTCWCVGPLPPDIQRRAEETYRAELVQGCPPAADDELFEHAMLSACAYWTIRSVSWSLQRSLEQDNQWGLASHRQRHVYRLETLAHQTREAGSLEAIGRVAAQVAHALRERWPPADTEVPIYPVFR